MPSGNPTVSDHFQTEYVTGVEHVFQNKGHIYGKFSHRKVITGATKAEFHQFGLLTAGPKVAGNIPRQKGDHKKMDVSAEKFFAMVEIEQFDLDQLASDDRDHAKQAAGLALARKADEVWRDAIALTDTTAIGGAGEFMSPSFSQEINRYFIAQQIAPYFPIIVAVPAMAFSQLMRFKEFANSQYTGPALPWADNAMMMARTWDGKHWICDPMLVEAGGLTRGYAWTPSAIAEVQIAEIRSIFSWENAEDAWLINNNFSQGNKIKPALKAGVVPLDIDTTILPESIDPETYEVSA